MAGRHIPEHPCLNGDNHDQSHQNNGECDRSFLHDAAFSLPSFFIHNLFVNNTLSSADGDTKVPRANS